MGLLDRITRPFFGGSTQSSNSQSSAQSQSGLDPRFANQFFSNLTNVQNTAGDLKAREFAGFTPDQMAGFGQVRQTAMNGPGFGSINQAAGALADGTGYNPMMIGPAPTVKAGSFLGSDIGSYMSPYLDKVAGSTMNQLERQRQIALTGNNAAATAAGAYGGSRHGIVDAETNRNFFHMVHQICVPFDSSPMDSCPLCCRPPLRFIHMSCASCNGQFFLFNNSRHGLRALSDVTDCPNLV